MKKFSTFISYATLLACLYTKISWLVYAGKFADAQQASASFHMRFSRNYLVFVDLFALVAAYYFFTKMQLSESKGHTLWNGFCFSLISLYLVLEIWQIF